jgi:hypothetical protein
MFTRASVIAACAAVLAVAAHTPIQAGSSWRDTTYVTFRGSVALPGITLAPGTYVFERGLLNTPNVVQVKSRDRTRVYLLALTNRVARPAGWPANRHIALGEVPTGGIPPVLAWYPTDGTFGHRFIYSDNR